MRDLETESLWSHLLGKAMRGKQKGTQLTMLAATITTWGEWKQRHPQTSVLSMPRTSKAFRENVWKSPGKFVYGVSLGLGRPAPAVSLAALQVNHFRQFTIDDTSLLITYSENGKRVQAFDAQVNGKTLQFALGKNGTLTDAATSSVWDMVSGKALSGTMKGKHLTVLPGTISYRKAWKMFYPDERVVE